MSNITISAAFYSFLKLSAEKRIQTLKDANPFIVGELKVEGTHMAHYKWKYIEDPIIPEARNGDGGAGDCLSLIFNRIYENAQVYALIQNEHEEILYPFEYIGPYEQVDILDNCSYSFDSGCPMLSFYRCGGKSWGAPKILKKLKNRQIGEVILDYRNYSLIGDAKSGFRYGCFGRCCGDILVPRKMTFCPICGRKGRGEKWGHDLFEKKEGEQYIDVKR